MARRSRTALAIVHTPHGRVLVRSQFSRKQGGHVLVLDGDPLALELIEPRNRLVASASHRRTITPPNGAVVAKEIRAFAAQCQARWNLLLRAGKRSATPAFGTPVRTLAELVHLHTLHHAAGLRLSSRSAYAKRWATLHRVIQPITPLAHIDRPRVQQVISDLAAAGLAPLTIRNLSSTLTSVLAWGVEAGHLDRAPTSGLVLPPVVDVHRDVLSDADVSRLLTAAEAYSPDALLLVALAVLAGLRAGEVLALHWQDVDLTGKTLRVRNRGAFLTKNGKGRVVPLGERLHAILAMHRADDGFVVRPDAPTRSNRRRWDFRKTFAAVLAAADCDRLPFHGLRRSFITRAVEHGVPISKVRQWVGHHSIVQTQVYVQHTTGYDGDIDRATSVG